MFLLNWRDRDNISAIFNLLDSQHRSDSTVRFCWSNTAGDQTAANSASWWLFLIGKTSTAVLVTACGVIRVFNSSWTHREFKCVWFLSWLPIMKIVQSCQSLLGFHRFWSQCICLIIAPKTSTRRVHDLVMICNTHPVVRVVIFSFNHGAYFLDWRLLSLLNYKPWSAIKARNKITVCFFASRQTLFEHSYFVYHFRI